MRYRLVHLSGSLAGRVQEMDAQEAVLGRDPDSADVLFPPGDRSVSRRHALLREENGVLLLRDLDSSTGTFLDGMDVEEAELGAGDVFELGRGGPRLRLEMEEAGTVVGMPRAAVLTDASRAAARDKAGPGGDPGLRIRLRFTGGSRKGDLVELAGSVFRIGRGAGCAVYTPHDPMVSSQHAKVVRLEQGYVLIDLESTNGTFLNGQRVERSPVQDGDVIGLGFGGPTLRVEVLALERGDLVGRTISIPNFAELVGRRASTLPVPVRDITLLDTTFEIGRDPAATVPLDSPIVSRRHARIDRGASGLVLTDLGSSNGTYVGGQRIQEARLSHGDRVVVGPFELVVSWPNLQAPPVLQLLDTRRRTRIDVRDVSVVAAGRALVENVSLAVPPGSLVALIGPSGAGKSTLLRALSGARPATTGEVLLNGRDLYRSFDTLKATIGYVPQDDIVHQQLTVGESLDYTARLRLPADTTFEERDRRISEVLSILELSERRETPIHRLSGGQRKRVSIATELLTEPNVLFLDEPTSGLDPGLEEALMLLLRELSYKGRTVVLVTHTLDNIHLCDAVALLVDGRLAFFGPPADARAQLDIEHMVNLYSRLKERTPEQWVAAFQASDVHAQWVAAPLASIPAPAPDAAPSAPRERTPPGSIRQWGILAGRYATTLLRDARNALLLLAQAPLIAGLIGLSLLYGQGDVAYTKPKNTILFLLALTSVWFGCSNAVRELVKERAIYLRERMVNLGVMPYVTSKVLVLGLLAIAQCVVFLLILDGWFGVPGRFAFLLGGMVLASFVGILLGLALSALSGSADRAMTLLPILLIPQVLFTSPAVQMDMKGPAGIVARAMPTWWAFDLLRRVALEADDSASDDELEARLQAGELVLMTKAHFTAMLQAGYRVFDYRSGIETTWTAELPDRLGERLPARLGRWRPVVVDAMVLAGFGAVLLGATVLLQKRHDRQH